MAWRVSPLAGAFFAQVLAPLAEAAFSFLARLRRPERRPLRVGLVVAPELRAIKFDRVVVQVGQLDVACHLALHPVSAKLRVERLKKENSHHGGLKSDVFVLEFAHQTLPFCDKRADVLPPLFQVDELDELRHRRRGRVPFVRGFELQPRRASVVKRCVLDDFKCIFNTCFDELIVDALVVFLPGHPLDARLEFFVGFEARFRDDPDLAGVDRLLHRVVCVCCRVRRLDRLPLGLGAFKR